jgi:hypothetical protein
MAGSDGRDAVQADFDIVRREIAQRCRHQPHQAVEHDFEHRKTLVGNQRRVDDGADAGLVLQLIVVDVESEEGVDFLLIEDALRRAARGGTRLNCLCERPIRGFWRDFRRGFVGCRGFRSFVGHVRFLTERSFA